MNKFLFKEEQKFTEWWRILFVMAGTIPAIISLVFSLLKLKGIHDPFNRSSMPVAISVIMIVFLLGVIWVFFSFKLEVWITKDGISYRFFPLIYKNKFISKEEIQSYEIRQFKAKREYGGRGFRNGFLHKWGKACIVSGNTGLQLYLKNGKKILFGTQRQQAIIYAMNEMMKDN